MAATYVFGEIPGHPEGATFRDRTDAKDAGVHQVTQQGISGNRTSGANSIVVNGGYEDDLDLGDEIIYTGAGGNDPATKKQIAHQSFEQLGNAALIVSEANGLPVRVVRGSRGDSTYAPKSGLRYDGLYRVESHWNEVGRSGYNVCRYRLLRLSEDEAAPYVRTDAETSSGQSSGVGTSRAVPDLTLPPVGERVPGRDVGVSVRVVRETAVSRWVKALYDYACQVCGVVLDLPFGHYAEGAHIRALGRPHLGPDTVDNVLCLCPTHHLLFDKGALYVDDSFQIFDHRDMPLGQLTRKAVHKINMEHVRYHRGTTGR